MLARFVARLHTPEGTAEVFAVFLVAFVIYGLSLLAGGIVPLVILLVEIYIAIEICIFVWFGTMFVTMRDA